MENGFKMIFVSKWFLIPVEYIDTKITVWPPDDISLIYFVNVLGHMFFFIWFLYAFDIL